MLDTSSRLLRLLALLQSRRYWAGPELAERLGITSRTVRRDVDRLRSLGYPVESSSGLAGGYQLAAGGNLPPLLLGDDEALAVALGLRLATAGTVAGLGEPALQALAKLEQVMPARLRKRVRNLHAAVQPLGSAGPSVPHALLTALAGASRDLTRIRFRYAAHDGRASAREVEPHGLACTGSRWYLLAWDLQREDWRTFRVDRIAGAPDTGARFLPRKVPGGDVAAYVSRAISVEPYAVRARVLLHAPLRRMRERIPPSVGRLQREDADSCVLEVGAPRIEGMAYHLAILDVDFEVLEPPELAEHVRRVGRRLMAASKRSRGA